MNEAPLFSSDRQQPPEGGRAAWLQAVDGVRTRAGYWPSAATPEAVRGTAILFPGRTEYVEKYYAPVTQFRRLGFAVSAMDWRGQGLADRALKDRRAGYVRDFAETAKPRRRNCVTGA
ncbi:MAG: alpha/beta hydrolase [Pseudomonadota bacterium]